MAGEARCQHQCSPAAPNPLASDAPDLRGKWRAISADVNGEPQPDRILNKHVEGIEKCGIA